MSSLSARVSAASWSPRSMASISRFECPLTSGVRRRPVRLRIFSSFSEGTLSKACEGQTLPSDVRRCPDITSSQRLRGRLFRPGFACAQLGSRRRNRRARHRRRAPQAGPTSQSDSSVITIDRTHRVMQLADMAHCRLAPDAGSAGRGMPAGFRQRLGCPRRRLVDRLRHDRRPSARGFRPQQALPPGSGPSF